MSLLFMLSSNRPASRRRNARRDLLRQRRAQIFRWNDHRSTNGARIPRGLRHQILQGRHPKEGWDVPAPGTRLRLRVLSQWAPQISRNVKRPGRWAVLQPLLPRDRALLRRRREDSPLRAIHHLQVWNWLAARGQARRLRPLGLRTGCPAAPKYDTEHSRVFASLAAQEWQNPWSAMTRG